MARNVATAFQDLTRIFTGNWQSPNDILSTPAEASPEDVVYKTEDPVEYKSKMLELQQNKYLQNRWKRVNQNLSMSAFAGLSNVKLMYRDADLMDAYPEIGAALDILSEEATLTTGSEEGMIVNVSSSSDRIKSILEDLFVNRLNMQVTAQMVMRGMVKYGNEFMLLDIDKKLGIKGWRRLPVGEVERIENGIVNPYGAPTTAADTSKDDMTTKFLWTNEIGGTMVPFRNWQIAHFRLLHNSMFLPYGCSALMAARRHFRMLALMEDMMLIYRLERSMERRVYKIFVGALDDADIPAFIENIADQFKRTPIVDPLTGQLDLRKNILPVWKKTPIPLVDGRVITIEQLAKEFEQGKKNKVYSVQKGTNKVVEGNVVWCGKTGHPDNLYKVTFYNNTHMVLAAEHEVMLLNGKMKRAEQLKPGEEIMPFSMERKDNTRQTFSNENYYTVKKVDIIEGDDVYCMTVEGDTAKTKDDRHNFALLTFTKDGEANDKGGCFVSNCASDDIFIPVRDPNAPTPIETLAGAKNLDAIDDIKYIQKKVCAALRIPQSFLNFEEQKGDGKNLALMDVRFARTVNKFQQAFLMELTKIATIHLYLLGFEDDLTNFTLTMNNPSTQSEQLEIENLQKKITAVRDAVSDPGGGIPAMSLTRALKTIMKWSEKDIKENFEEIRLERALSAELEKTAEIIKRTGIFDTVDRIYGEPNAQYQESQGGQEGMDGMGGPSGGGGGGFGGGIDDFGAPGAEGEDVMGEEGTEPTAEMGGADTAPQGPDQQPMENIVRMKPLIKEHKDNRGTQIILDKLFESIDKRIPKPVRRVDVYDKTLMINEDINKAIGLIDEYTKEDGIKPTEDDE
jgi:intein/homing endonuclease